MHQFKTKESQLIAYQLHLRNISKVFSGNDLKQIWLNGYVHDFSVHYEGISVDNISDIHILNY